MANRKNLILQKIPIADSLSVFDPLLYKHLYHLLFTLGFKSDTHAHAHTHTLTRSLTPTGLVQLMPRIGLGPFYFTDVRDTLTLIVLIFFSFFLF